MHDCPLCSGPMKLVDSFWKKPKKGSLKYKVRKYECEVCQHRETIYGGKLNDNNPD